MSKINCNDIYHRSLDSIIVQKDKNNKGELEKHAKSDYITHIISTSCTPIDPLTSQKVESTIKLLQNLPIYKVTVADGISARLLSFLFERCIGPPILFPGIYQLRICPKRVEKGI